MFDRKFVAYAEAYPFSAIQLFNALDEAGDWLCARIEESMRQDGTGCGLIINLEENDIVVTMDLECSSVVEEELMKRFIREELFLRFGNFWRETTRSVICPDV